MGYLIKSGIAGGFQKQSVARASDGTLWAVYCIHEGSKIAAALSSDDGESWTEEIVAEGELAKQPCLAIDSSDDLWVAWASHGYGDYSDRYNIVYSKRNHITTAWSDPVVISDTPDGAVEHQQAPEIDICRGDWVHVVWCGLGWGDYPARQACIYRRISPWADEQLIACVDADQWDLSVACSPDLVGGVYVVWHGQGWGDNPTVNNIQFRDKTGVSWWPQEAVTDKDVEQHMADLCLDTDGNVHVTWTGLGWDDPWGFLENMADYQNIRWRMRDTGGSWTSHDAACVSMAESHQYGPAIMVQGTDNQPRILWRTSAGGVRQSLRQYFDGFGWGFWDEQWTGETGVNVAVLCTMWPVKSGIRTNFPTEGYAFVFAEGSVPYDYRYTDVGFDPDTPGPADSSTGPFAGLAGIGFGQILGFGR